MIPHGNFGGYAVFIFRCACGADRNVLFTLGRNGNGEQYFKTECLGRKLFGTRKPLICEHFLMLNNT